MKIEAKAFFVNDREELKFVHERVGVGAGGPGPGPGRHGHASARALLARRCLHLDLRLGGGRRRTSVEVGLRFLVGGDVELHLRLSNRVAPRVRLGVDVDFDSHVHTIFPDLVEIGGRLEETVLRFAQRIGCKVVDDRSGEPNFDEGDNIQSRAFTVSSATGGPDLGTAGTQLEDEEAEPGDRVSIEYTFENEGNADSGDFEVGYYFLPTHFSFFTREQAVLAERETLGGVEAGEEEDESEQVTDPAGLEPDRYKLWIVLDDFDQISEEDETDNFGGDALHILAEPGETLPDLTIGGRPSTFVNFFYVHSIVTPAIGPAADAVQMAYKLANRGDAAVEASSVEVGYYLSADSSFSEEEDVRLGTTTVGTYEDTEVPAEPGAETYVEVQQQLPAEDALPSGPGDYFVLIVFVLIVADPDGQIAESGEENNTGAPQPRTILRSAEVAEGETGTFAPSEDIGASAEITQNGDESGGGHLLFRRLEGTAPQSTFDGSSAQAPDGTTLTPDHAAPVRWAITGSMLTDVSFRPRLDTMGVPGIEDPDRLLVMGRKKPAEAWEPFDTNRSGSTLIRPNRK